MVCSVNPKKPATNTVDAKGSHFFKCVGHCAAVTATCLCEFYVMLQTMDSETIKYYLQRGDFQSWLKANVDAAELTNMLNQIKEVLSGETLKQELLRLVQGAASEMKKHG